LGAKSENLIKVIVIIFIAKGGGVYHWNVCGTVLQVSDFFFIDKDKNAKTYFFLNFRVDIVFYV
jgi:hypothetical protein